MGCDLLALDLVRHWEFLKELPSAQLKKDGAISLVDGTVDYRKMLRRRSSLVVADIPTKSSLGTEPKSPVMPKKPQPPPTMFHEPDASSLLDSFGF
jgi:hypothetical protein